MTTTPSYPLKTLLAACVAASLFACSETEQPGGKDMTASNEPAAAATEAVISNDNPFFVDWDTPYGIPPFSEIRDEHYKPAFDAAIQQQRADVEKIRNNPEPPTLSLIHI